MKVKIFRELSLITTAGMAVIDADVEAQMSAFAHTVNVKSVHQTQTSTVSRHQDSCLYVTTTFSVWYNEMDKTALQKLLDTSLHKFAQDTNLDSRCRNCLNNANLQTLRQICAKEEYELLKYKNFGRKSLQSLKETLAKIGLRVGMSEQELSGN
jgi:DNA-directed RNA polymerase alpha subunit